MHRGIRHPNFSMVHQEKNKTKQKKTSTNIKHDDINMNIINTDSFNLHNSFLKNDNRYMKVTLKSKLIGVAR